LDQVISWASGFGAYTLLDLQWLDAERKIAPLPDEDSVKLWSLLAERYRGNAAEQSDEEERILVKPTKRLEMPCIREIRLNGCRRCRAPEWIDHHHLKQVAPNTDRCRQYRNPKAYAANAVAKRTRGHRPNENKMSDGGRERASLGVEVWKSSSKVERTAVRRSLHRLVRCFGGRSNI
jgi:hypothetical protein